MQGSLVCSPEQARQILEAVAEHRVSVASNPFYGLKEILELVWLARDGKMKGDGIAVVGRERKRSGRSWRWVEMHCCPSSATSTPGKVVSKTMRWYNGMGRFFLVLVNRPFMDVIGKVIGEVGEEEATSTDVTDLDRITGGVTLWLWMKPLGRIKGTAFGSTGSKQDQTELI